MKKRTKILGVVLFAAIAALLVVNLTGQTTDTENITVNLVLDPFVVLEVNTNVLTIHPPVPPEGNWTPGSHVLVTITGSLANSSAVCLYAYGTGPFVCPATSAELPLNGVDFSITGESGDMLGVQESFLETPTLLKSFPPGGGVVQAAGQIRINYKNDLHLPGNYSTTLVLDAVIQ